MSLLEGSSWGQEKDTFEKDSFELTVQGPINLREANTIKENQVTLLSPGGRKFKF